MQYLADYSLFTPTNKTTHLLTTFLDYLVPNNINPAPTKLDLESILYSSIRGIANMRTLAWDASLASVLTQPDRWCHVVRRTEELLFSGPGSKHPGDTKFRNDVIYSFLKILNGFEEREEWAKQIVLDRATYLLIFRIWSLKGSVKITDKYYTTYLLQVSMAWGIVPTDDPKRVRSVLRPKLNELGNPEAVARTMLENAIYHFQQQPFNIPLLHQITCLLFKVFTLPDHPVAIHLSKEKIVGRVVRILSSPQLDSRKATQKAEIELLVKQSMHFVIHAIVSTKTLGLDYMHEALENGFLGAVLKHSPLVLDLDPGLYGNMWTLLRCYLVYPSIIKSMAKAYGKFTATESWAQEANHQVTHDIKTLGDLLLKRLAFVVYVGLLDKHSKTNICAFVRPFHYLTLDTN